MKIYYKDAPEIPFHKPRVEAEAMIAAGIAFAYVKPAPVRKPDAHFAVQIWKIDNQPFIAAWCNGCATKNQFSGPTAHRTSVFRHCGVTDAVPQDITADYTERRARWAKAQKAVAPEAVAEKLPAFELSHF
jgi:hypothetical protein